LAHARNIVPDLFPLSFRYIAVFIIILGINDLRKQRKAAKWANPYELLIFRISAIFWSITLAVFVLIRTPIGSRLNTLLTIAFLSIIIWLLLAERVFDAGGTAKIAFGHVLRFLIYILVLAPVLEFYRSLVVLRERRRRGRWCYLWH